MTTEQFWEIIADSHADVNPVIAEGNGARQMARLKQRLSALPSEEIVAFSEQYGERLWGAYHWDLWGAAYLHEGGCSDDGFHYFRDWLISMGKDIYEAALADPDSLADVFSRPEIECIEFEEFGYVYQEVYEAKTGQDIPARSGSRPSEPGGQPWYNKEDEGEAELKRRLPKIYAKFWDGED